MKILKKYSLLLVCLLAMNLVGCTTMIQLMIDITNITSSERYVDGEPVAAWNAPSWPHLEGAVRLVYAEPIFDNYDYFNEEWTGYKDNFTGWFKDKLKDGVRDASVFVRIEQVNDNLFEIKLRDSKLDGPKLRYPVLKSNVVTFSERVVICVAPIVAYTRNHEVGERKTSLYASYSIVDRSSNKLLAYGKVRSFGFDALRGFNMAQMMFEEIIKGTPLVKEKL